MIEHFLFAISDPRSVNARIFSTYVESFRNPFACRFAGFVADPRPILFI
jgi:hypothetical protein